MENFEIFILCWLLFTQYLTVAITLIKDFKNRENAQYKKIIYTSYLLVFLLVPFSIPISIIVLGCYEGFIFIKNIFKNAGKFFKYIRSIE